MKTTEKLKKYTYGTVLTIGSIKPPDLSHKITILLIKLHICLVK